MKNLEQQKLTLRRIFSPILVLGFLCLNAFGETTPEAPEELSLNKSLYQAQVTLVIDEVSSVQLGSLNWLNRHNPKISSLTPMDVTAAPWPADAPVLDFSNLKQVQILADNASPALEPNAETDAVHVESAQSVLNQCRQAAFIASSRPDKYDLTVTLAIRDVSNIVGAQAAVGVLAVYSSEEFLGCALVKEAG